MKLVIIESPYKGDTIRNNRYLRACIRDCIKRGESPYASHRMLTDALDDNDPAERKLGIEAGLAWRRAFFRTENGVRHVLPVFYLDLGWSGGMKNAHVLYEKEGVHYERRNLPPEDLFFSDLVRCAGFYGDERAHTDPACGWTGARKHLVNNATCPTCGAGHIVEQK